MTHSTQRLPAWWLPLALLTLLPAAISVAAESGVSAPGVRAGFLHPLLGWDHLCALLAVGIWSSQLGQRARLALPLAMLASLLAGGLAGWIGWRIPAVEAGILTSLLLLGSILATGLRIALGRAAVLTAAFGFFHGHAHITELPAQAEAGGYALGFLLASALLLAGGAGLGWASQRFGQGGFAQWSGLATLTCGAVLLATKF